MEFKWEFFATPSCWWVSAQLITAGSVWKAHESWAESQMGQNPKAWPFILCGTKIGPFPMMTTSYLFIKSPNRVGGGNRESGPFFLKLWQKDNKQWYGYESSTCTAWTMCGRFRVDILFLHIRCTTKLVHFNLSSWMTLSKALSRSKPTRVIPKEGN